MTSKTSIDRFSKSFIVSHSMCVLFCIFVPKITKLNLSIKLFLQKTHYTLRVENKVEAFQQKKRKKEKEEKTILQREIGSFLHNKKNVNSTSYSKNVGKCCYILVDTAQT